jgi:anti-sigma factor RsiW
MNGGAHVREELGAYVLGGLEPAERRVVDAHVAECGRCRDELARFSVMPGVLDRLSAEEVLEDPSSVPALVRPQLAAGLAAAEQGLRRQVRRWRVATAAASLATIAAVAALVVTDSAPTETVRVEVAPVAADAAQVEGTVAAFAWEWGTTVEVDISRLPARDSYTIWIVDVDDEWVAAGTWGPTRDGSALVRSATAVPTTRVARVEVHDDRGGSLLAAEFRPA